MFRKAIILTITLGMATGAVACSSASDQPTPPSDSSAAPTNDQPSDPSLTIDHQKNLVAVTDPCALLNEPQLKQLGNEGKPEPLSSPAGKKCSWSGEKFSVSVLVSAPELNRDAERIYTDAANHGNPERFKIDGYPAAVINAYSTSGRVELAVADKQTFVVDYTKFTNDTPEMNDTVGYAKKIASEVLKNIPDA